jgi:hypothetical protein
MAGHRRCGVEGAHQVQQSYAGGKFSVDRRMEVLNAVQSEQSRIPWVAVGHAEAVQRPVDGLDDYVVFGAFLRAGQQALAEGGVDCRVIVSWR